MDPAFIQPTSEDCPLPNEHGTWERSHTLPSIRRGPIWGSNSIGGGYIPQLRNYTTWTRIWINRALNLPRIPRRLSVTHGLKPFECGLKQICIISRTGCLAVFIPLYPHNPYNPFQGRNPARLRSQATHRPMMCPVTTHAPEQLIKDQRG